MKTLPNGLTVFNSTPHPIRFWGENWSELVEVGCDELISATPKEEVVGVDTKATFVKMVYVPNDAGREVIKRAVAAGAGVIVGSIIAAQAYPGAVVAMIPAKGFERVRVDQIRMKPDRFTVFTGGDAQ